MAITFFLVSTLDPSHYDNASTNFNPWEFFTRLEHMRLKRTRRQPMRLQSTSFEPTSPTHGAHKSTISTHEVSQWSQHAKGAHEPNAPKWLGGVVLKLDLCIWWLDNFHDWQICVNKINHGFVWWSILWRYSALEGQRFKYHGGNWLEEVFL